MGQMAGKQFILSQPVLPRPLPPHSQMVWFQWGGHYHPSLWSEVRAGRAVKPPALWDSSMKRRNPEFFVMLLGMKSTLSCCGVSLELLEHLHLCLHGGQLLFLWEEEASTREVEREGEVAFWWHPPSLDAAKPELIFFFWLHWVFIAACGLSLVVESGGYSLAAVHGLLIAVASVVEHRL